MRFFLSFICLLPLFAVAQDKASIEPPKAPLKYDTVTKTTGNKQFVQLTRVQGKPEVIEGYLYKGKKSGVWSTYINNKISTIETFDAGIRNGIYVLFNYSNGAPSKQENYENGTLNGPSREFHKNGNLKALAYYTNDKLNGYRKTYYQSGDLESEERYKDGAKNGEQIYYYENGKKAAIYTFAHGGKHGLATFYNRNGYVTGMGKYSSGKKTGEWKEFHDTGQLSAQGNYVYDKKKGAWKEFDMNGKFTKTVTY